MAGFREIGDVADRGTEGIGGGHGHGGRSMQAAGQGESGMVVPERIFFQSLQSSGSRRLDEFLIDPLRRQQKVGRALNDSSKRTH
jgi:hypothetical protein